MASAATILFKVTGLERPVRYCHNITTTIKNKEFIIIIIITTQSD